MPKGVRKVKVPVAAQQQKFLSFFSTSTKSLPLPLTPKNKKMDRCGTQDSPKKSKEGDGETNIEDFELSKGIKNCTSTPTTPPSKRIKLNGSENIDIETRNGSSGSSAPLTPEQKTMVGEKQVTAKLLRLSKSLEILDAKMGTTWFTALEDEFKKEYFKDLSDFVVSARDRATIYPPLDNVFEWTKQCAIRDVKVVILGQDPYHGPNQAHGLCFSVKKGVSAPPSLVNMYKELASDIPGFVIPNHGCLGGWAGQGVLLLNAVLTVEAGKANSHRERGWEKVTDAVISWISKNLDSVVFLLWGAYAHKKGVIVDKKKHHVLQSVHPSPLSAHRGFLGCKHFSKCNELLLQSGKTPIDWNNLP